MSVRKTKRWLGRKLFFRFHRPNSWRSIEDQLWLDAPLVGWEFGSPDYFKYESGEEFAEWERAIADPEVETCSLLTREHL